MGRFREISDEVGSIASLQWVRLVRFGCFTTEGSDDPLQKARLLHFIGFCCFIALGSVAALQWVLVDHCGIGIRGFKED